VSGKTPAPRPTKDKTSFRVPESDSDEEDRQPFSYWNNRPTTFTPNPRVGRNPRSLFLRPPSRQGETTSGSASFHSIENQDELDSTDKLTFQSETEPIDEPTTDMATQGPPGPTGGMDIDHEGKSYLKKPEPFDGNRREVNNFIYACDLFFEGSSDKDFPTDKQKIIFILSYMSEGEALRWRKNYIETVVKQADGSYTWPTKVVFLATFKAAFLNEDEKEESIRKLDNISQRNRTADEYVNEFRLTVSKAGLPTDNDMIIRTFRKGLNRALATRILYSDKKPDALNNTATKKGWYTIAIEFDRIHRDNVQALDDRTDKPTGRQLNPPNNRFRQAYGRGYAAGPAYNRGNYQQPRYDPNAMDIDVVTTAINAMTYEEQGEFLKKGLCFKCGQPGHVARNCPTSNNRSRNTYNNNRNDNRNSFIPRSKNPFKRNDTNAPKKPRPHKINKYIRALNAEERNTLWDIAEEDDDKKGPKEKDFI